MVSSSSNGVSKLPTGIVPIIHRAEVYQFIWCASIFLVLTTIWTCLRIYSRRVRNVALALEDWLYYIALISFYGFIAALFMAVYLGGAGYHMTRLTPYHVARLTQSFLVLESLYGVTMCGVKWSMLFMLKRIFAVPRFEIVTWIIIGLQAAWLVMTVLIGFLICRPVSKNWDPTIPGTCGDRIAGYTAVSVVNVIIDCMMLILPLPMIYNLQTKTGYKLCLFCIFGIGIVTIVFSVVRLLSLNELDFDDFSYTAVPVMTWTAAEAGVAVLVASSALLRPVVDKVIQCVKSRSSRSSAPSNAYTNSQSKMNSKLRRGFVNVVDSDDSLELGMMGPRTEIQGGEGHSKGTLDAMTTAGPEFKERKGRMTIVVQKQVEQTFAEREDHI
ncbi:hypothetical protein VP1G_10204 [Cytospora mali]|uniref:Rhodopsin domain-containing protein n=1 Tax=Cytospora mali TaxID=578113 RepID=A0A194VGD8_CYTMA|nr:hypothetical protein VP1G_10204 [Valsa mali var. pyri (nom. inval.)]